MPFLDATTGLIAFLCCLWVFVPFVCIFAKSYFYDGKDQKKFITFAIGQFFERCALILRFIRSKNIDKYRGACFGQRINPVAVVLQPGKPQAVYLLTKTPCALIQKNIPL